VKLITLRAKINITATGPENNNNNNNNNKYVGVDVCHRNRHMAMRTSAGVMGTILVLLPANVLTSINT
jgi:hypothetical protein